MRNKLEKRREKLINKLIIFNVYKKGDKQLYELSMAELQYEMRKYKSQYHPHGEFGSIQWI